MESEAQNDELKDPTPKKTLIKERAIDRQPLPFDLTLIAQAPWKSLILIVLALVFGWADWRFAQTWRVPARPTTDAAAPIKSSVITTSCFSFATSVSVLGSPESPDCDASYQFGPERIARLRITALRGKESSVAVDSITHSNDKPIESEITLASVKAQQTVYLDMGQRYISIVVPSPPKAYTDKKGRVAGFQLIAPYGDDYAQKSTIDDILKSWSWL